MIKKRYGLITVVCVAALLFFGCGGPLSVNYGAKKEVAGASFKLRSPATVLLKPYLDLRSEKNPRRIGTVTATVADMTGNELILSQDVSTLVTSAFREELASSGFNVSDVEETADYIMTGEIREFSLNIGPRDRIAIEVFTVLKEKDTGRIIWSGVEKEEGDRYAGVMGNSRRTINDYIVRSLSMVARKTIEEAGNSIPPARFEKDVENKPQQRQPAQKEDTEDAEKGAGSISITTSPSRAKVYIGDVYYGLSPVKIDITPGIYEVRLVLRGYTEQKEKVSIRAGYTTEMEVVFEKE